MTNDKDPNPRPTGLGLSGNAQPYVDSRFSSKPAICLTDQEKLKLLVPQAARIFTVFLRSVLENAKADQMTPEMTEQMVESSCFAAERILDVAQSRILKGGKE